MALAGKKRKQRAVEAAAASGENGQVQDGSSLKKGLSKTVAAAAASDGDSEANNSGNDWTTVSASGKPKKKPKKEKASSAVSYFCLAAFENIRLRRLMHPTDCRSTLSV